MRLLHSRRGQSVIEYTLIAVLVMMSVVVMGPYLARSVNAHFKLWDDAVQDGLDSRSIPKPNPDVPPPDCTCDWKPGDCGVQGCGKMERMYYKDCCGGRYKCEAETTPPPGKAECCDDPSRTNVCWRSGNDTKNLAKAAPAGYKIPCGLGDRIYQYDCGTKAGLQVCKPDGTTDDGDRNCIPQCLWENLPQRNSASPCPNYDVGLIDDAPVTLGQTCTGKTKCEAVCQSGLILTTTESGLACLAPASCSDGIMNQDETAIDCGGENCAACPQEPKKQTPRTTACSAFDVPLDANTIWKKDGNYVYYLGHGFSGDAYSCIGVWDEVAGVWVSSTSCKYGDLRECRTSPLSPMRYTNGYPACPSGKQGWGNGCSNDCSSPNYLDNGYCVTANNPRF
jgi:hypothetical protein